MDLLSPEDKADCMAAQDDVFDTFKEQILIFHTPDKTYISTSITDYNFGFGDSNPSVDFIATPVSGFFDATITYIDQQDNQKLTKQQDTRITVPDGYVKICVGMDGNQYLRAAKNIIFDGDEFTIVSDKRPRGIFERKYFDYYLQKPER